MNISGIEKGLGASYGAKRIDDNEEVYGIGVIKKDDEISYLIQLFQTNDLTDGAPAAAYYISVVTDSIFILEEENVVLENNNLSDNKINGEPVKEYKKENRSFGKRLITPYIDE